MSNEIIVGIVALVGGGLIGYVVAAHNSKANKEQVSALEAKLSEVADQVKHKVEPTVVVAPVATQAPVAVAAPAEPVQTEAAPATIDQSVAK